MAGEPSDNLYVTNLPSGLDESMVTQFFAIYGTVTTCKVLKNPIATGKTAALVRFANAEEAASILETLNGTVPTGLDEPVQIKFAAKKGEGKGAMMGNAGMGGMGAMGMANSAKGYGKWDGGAGSSYMASPYGSPAAGKGNGGCWGGGGGGGTGEPEISDNIYVQGLPAGTTEDSLRQVFVEFGNIKSLKLLPSKGPDAPCAALIRYDSEETAKMTKEILNGQTPEGFSSPLIVRYANKPGMNNQAWQGAQPGWGDDSSWKGQGKGYAAQAGYAAHTAQVPPGALDCVTLVNMIYQSDMLPGGKKYINEKSCVYVAGLPNDATDTHLYKMFAPYGAIHSANTKIGGSAEYSWAIGFVNYLDPASAEAAITAYNGMALPDGSSLKVTIKTANKGCGKQ